MPRQPEAMAGAQKCGVNRAYGTGEEMITASANFAAPVVGYAPGELQ